MSKRKKRSADAPRKRTSAAWLTTADAYDTLCISGYTPLDRRPEIVTGCRVIAELISSMTIYLMANTDRGDVRIKNELSRAVDITPSRNMTRRVWMDAIVMNLLLYGEGNSVVLPRTRQGYLESLDVIPPGYVSFSAVPGSMTDYTVMVNGVTMQPDEVLHFIENPDPNQPWRGQGLRVALRDVAHNLEQAAATEKGFMASKWKPSLIVKVDGMTEEFSSPAGRKKLLDEYIASGEAGEPWMIPADQFSVEQIKPLSLTDLAISDMVEIDKRTVASILRVPPFVLGIGDFNRDAWNAFVNSRIMGIARMIEQELTRKLLYSPKMYWKMNVASLYSYDLQTLEAVYADLYNRGLATGNEVRDKLSMEPIDGLDKLVMLENYIPADKIGDQKKLTQGDE